MASVEARDQHQAADVARAGSKAHEILQILQRMTHQGVTNQIRSNDRPFQQFFQLFLEQKKKEKNKE